MNLNESTKKEVMGLNGVGSTICSRIIDNRPYSDVTDLLTRIKGLTMNKINKWETQLIFSKSTEKQHTTTSKFLALDSCQCFICNPKKWEKSLYDIMCQDSNDLSTRQDSNVLNADQLCKSCLQIMDIHTPIDFKDLFISLLNHGHSNKYMKYVLSVCFACFVSKEEQMKQIYNPDKYILFAQQQLGQEDGQVSEVHNLNCLQKKWLKDETNYLWQYSLGGFTRRDEIPRNIDRDIVHESFSMDVAWRIESAYQWFRTSLCLENGDEILFDCNRTNGHVIKITQTDGVSFKTCRRLDISIS